MQNDTSRPVKMTSLNMSFRQANHTNQNHINPNHNNSSYTDSIDSAEVQNPTYDNQSTAPYDSYDSANKVSNPTINLNLFNNLNPRHLSMEAELKQIQSLISEIKSTRKTSVRVGGKDLSIYQVRDAFSRLTSRHIEYILDSLAKKNISNSDIKNHKAYLLTTLFNASFAILPVDVNAVKNSVKANINFDYLIRNFHNNLKELNEIFNIIIEVLISRKNSFRIAKGEIDSDIVKQAFASLSYEHIEYSLNSILKNTSDVKSTKAYIQTVLWNSLSTLNIQTTFDSNNFLYNILGFPRVKNL
jgi:vacuolar-type H+-ATPase subunit I/STV1